MRKTLFFLLGLVFITFSSFAQTWLVGSGQLTTTPQNTKVGIGITTPTEMLHVYGGAFKVGNSSSAADRALNMIKIGDGNYIQIGEWEADDLLSFKANRYNFTNGKVGIGTTLPQQALHVVNGNILISKTSTNTTSSSEMNKNTYPMDTNYSSNPPIMRAPGSTNGSILFGSNISPNSPYGSWGIEYDDGNSMPGLNFWRPWGDNFILYLANNGNVGIGTHNPQYKLDVTGEIGAKNISVNNTASVDWSYANRIKVNRELTKALTVTNTSNGGESDVFVVYGNGVVNAKKLYTEAITVTLNAMNIYWYDHVFDQDYKLRPLSEVEQFIKQHKHLPEIPSEKEVIENGIDIGDMQGKLLLKIEELTLYVIELEKQIKEIKEGK